jgi:hypothetical protein
MQMNLEIKCQMNFSLLDFGNKINLNKSPLDRFILIDPKIESAESWSIYSTMLNNPVKNIDPLGDLTVSGAGFWANAWEGIKD